MNFSIGVQFERIGQHKRSQSISSNFSSQLTWVKFPWLETRDLKWREKFFNGDIFYAICCKHIGVEYNLLNYRFYFYYYSIIYPILLLGIDNFIEKEADWMARGHLLSTFTCLYHLVFIKVQSWLSRRDCCELNVLLTKIVKL